MQQWINSQLHSSHYSYCIMLLHINTSLQIQMLNWMNYSNITPKCPCICGGNSLNTPPKCLKNNVGLHYSDQPNILSWLVNQNSLEATQCMAICYWISYSTIAIIITPINHVLIYNLHKMPTGENSANDLKQSMESIFNPCRPCRNIHRNNPIQISYCWIQRT